MKLDPDTIQRLIQIGLTQDQIDETEAAANGSPSPDQIIAIFLDPRTSTEIARDHRIHPKRVGPIKTRSHYAELTKHLPGAPRAKTGRPRIYPE
jgi:hypothetical protein